MILINNKTSILFLSLIAFSYCTIESFDNSQQASNDFKWQENVRLRMENLQLRSDLGIRAQWIRTYDERVLPEWELSNSYDLINNALREERHELEIAKAKANHQNPPKSAVHKQTADWTLTQSVGFAAFTLLGISSLIIYVTKWLRMTPEKAKETFLNIQTYYDFTIDEKHIINFARVYGNKIEASMFHLSYSIPLHRTVTVFSDKITILKGIIPYLNKADEQNVEQLVHKLESYIAIITECDEYIEETINTSNKRKFLTIWIGC